MINYNFGLSKIEQYELHDWIFDFHSKHFRNGYIAYLILHCSYIFFDYLYFPDLIQYSIVLRVVIGIVFLSIPIIFSFTNYYKKYFLIINTIASTIVPVSLALLLVIYEHHDNSISYIYFGGLILQVTIVGLFIYKWNIAFISALIISFSYVLFRFLLYNESSFEGLSLQNVLFLFLTGGITTLISYFYQEIKAKMYLAEKEIIEEKRVIEENKLIVEKYNSELIKSNSEKDKLFSIIAHDLRSPFNGFLGLTSLMSENINDFSIEEIQDISSQLHKSASNLYDLLENLLQWSKIQKGMISINKVECNLKNIIISNIDLISKTAFNKEIELINLIQEDLIIISDASILNIILRNMISNSVKFTPRGGKIEIGTIPHIPLNNGDSEAGGLYDKNNVIYIKDNGIGMNSEMISKLFRIDQKVSRPGTENEPSSGLGLILCKDFIEILGGEIYVESEEGKGSTFYFTLK